MKKLLVFCSVLFLCCTALFSPVSAETEREGQVKIVNAASNSPQTSLVFSSEKAGQTIEDAIYNALKTRATSLQVEEYGLTLAEMEEKFFGVACAHPELFYVKTQFSYTLDSEKGTIKSLRLTNTYASYASDENALAEKKAAIDREVNAILASIPEAVSPAEKALLVHDWFAVHYEYDTPASLQGDPVEAHRIEGLFLNKKAVCQGYALGYMYVLEKLGIDSVYVSSKPMNHAWNLVNIGENWYHVDVTWSDQGIAGLGDVTGHVTHENFLRSDAGIASTEHEGWSLPYTCTSDYDGFWKLSEGKYAVGSCLYHENKWYFLSYDDIMVYDPFAEENKTTILRANVKGKWSVQDGRLYGVNLGVAFDRIFFNTKDGIYSIKPDGTDETLYFMPDCGTDVVFGMWIYDGVLHYGLVEELDIPLKKNEMPMQGFTMAQTADEILVKLYGNQETDIRAILAFYQGDLLLKTEIAECEESHTYTLENADGGGDRAVLYIWSGLKPVYRVPLYTPGA